MWHSTQFNCTECSFQGSSNVILTKHINLAHKKDVEKVLPGTFKCTKCNQQLSSKWNLNNHMRDSHEKLKECEFYNMGICNFPETVCWDIHKKKDGDGVKVTKEQLECHTCKNVFNSKHVLMMHRLKEHPEKIKPCRDQNNCTRHVCWYNHKKAKQSEPTAEIEEINQSWLSDELDSEKDFQEVPVLPKPLLNP